MMVSYKSYTRNSPKRIYLSFCCSAGTTTSRKARTCSVRYLWPWRVTLLTASGTQATRAKIEMDHPYPRGACSGNRAHCQARDPDHGVAWAAKQLAKREPWKTFVKAKESGRTCTNPAEALRKAYYSFKGNGWAEMMRNAFKIHDHEGTIAAWEERVADYVKNPHPEYFSRRSPAIARNREAVPRLLRRRLRSFGVADGAQPRREAGGIRRGGDIRTLSGQPGTDPGVGVAGTAE